MNPTPKIVIGEHTITIEHNGEQIPLNPSNAALKGTGLDIPNTPADDYYTGDAVKALKDEGEIEGYLIVWGNEQQRDKQGEFFTSKTELRLDYYQSRPVLFHHGLGEADSVKIGEIYDLQVDSYGVKAKARLYLNHDNEFIRRYANFAWQEAKANKMFWSSGSIAHLVEVEPNGQIMKWPLVEGSLTPAPAEPHRTKISAIRSATKSAYQQFIEAQDIPKEVLPKEDNDVEVTAKADNKKQSKQDIPNRKTKRGKIKMMDQAMIEALIEKGLSAEQVLAVIGTLGEAATPEPDGMMADEPMDDEEEPPFRSEEAPLDPPTNGKSEQNNKEVKAAIAALRKENANLLAQFKAIQTAPPTEQLPGRKQGQTKKQPILRKRSKWANLDWRDMVFVKQLLDGASRGQNEQRWTPSDPEDFARELADKIEKETDYRFDGAAIKTARAIKDDEVNYSTLASYGDEFVPDLWRSQLWETPRLDNPVFREMQVIEMPSDPYNLPVESTDPTIYAVSETADENQLGINDSNAAIPDTQVGTSNTTLNAGKLAARIQISAELVEDSIIPVAQHWRFKAVRKMEDARDFVILSADASTGSSNINYDGASIVAGNKALYGGGDGLLHLPLVDNSTVAVDMGGVSPTLAKIRQARTKLSTEFLADFGNLMYFCDPLSSVALASLDEALNFQINGDQSSFNTGMVGRIDNIPVFVTSQMSLATSTGVVSSTSTDNTLGRLLLVHKPSWYVGFRRNISVNLAFEPAFDAWTLVVSMRMALARRATDTASLLYNISV